MLEKCVLTILELNWNQRLGYKRTKLNICHHMLTPSTKLQNWSFHVVERTRTSSKCQKMKNARAKRAKIQFFIDKYANLWGFCCRRRRGCLRSLLSAVRLERHTTEDSSYAFLMCSYMFFFPRHKRVYGWECSVSVGFKLSQYSRLISMYLPPRIPLQFYKQDLLWWDVMQIMMCACANVSYPFFFARLVQALSLYRRYWRRQFDGREKKKTEKLFFMFSPCACLARLARFTAKSNHPLLPATPVAQATRPLSRLTIETAKL